ncbi:MAG: hypothetical protein ABSB79_12480 [Syntrophales bacterium]|jgi:hypothetical protein
MDVEGKQLHIRRTFNHGRFFSPKTRNSIHTIDLSPSVIRELAKWKLASLPNESGLIFTIETGHPIAGSNLLNLYFKPALKAAASPIADSMT